MLSTKTRFDRDLWNELRDMAQASGQGKRHRLTTPGGIGFHAVVSPSSPSPCVKIVGPVHSGMAQSRFPRMNGLAVTVEPSSSLQQDGEKSDIIVIKQTDGDDRMFNALANDLVATVVGDDAHEDFDRLATRLSGWQEMLKQPPIKSPSANQALGLLGELIFIRDVLIPSIGPKEALRSWYGPKSGKKDFEVGRRAFEIKSSSDPGVQTISISSFEQMDEEGHDDLYLVMNHFARDDDGGESLVCVLESLKSLISDSDDMTSSLVALVQGSGWAKETLLENVANQKYRLDTKSFFRVDGAFPRYTRRDRKPGTMNLKYEIILADCLPYGVKASDVEKKLKDLK